MRRLIPRLRRGDDNRQAVAARPAAGPRGVDRRVRRGAVGLVVRVASDEGTPLVQTRDVQITPTDLATPANSAAVAPHPAL